MQPKLIISGNTFRLPLPGENIEPLKTEVCLLNAGLTTADETGHLNQDIDAYLYLVLGFKGLFFRNYDGSYGGQVLDLKSTDLGVTYDTIRAMYAAQAATQEPIYFTIGLEPGKSLQL